MGFRQPNDPASYKRGWDKVGEAFGRQPKEVAVKWGIAAVKKWSNRLFWITYRETASENYNLAQLFDTESDAALKIKRLKNNWKRHGLDVKPRRICDVIVTEEDLQLSGYYSPPIEEDTLNNKYDNSNVEDKVSPIENSQTVEVHEDSEVVENPSKEEEVEDAPRVAITPLSNGDEDEKGITGPSNETVRQGSTEHGGGNDSLTQRDRGDESPPRRRRGRPRKYPLQEDSGVGVTNRLSDESSSEPIIIMVKKTDDDATVNKTIAAAIKKRKAERAIEIKAIKRELKIIKTELRRLKREGIY